MNAVKKNINNKTLRNFLPLDKLSIDKLDELLDKSLVEEIPAGRVLFRQGEKDKRNIYLLDGQVELQVTGNTRPEIVKAKTVEAKYPLADTLPRPSTCRARSSVTVLIVDTDHLEILLEHDPSGTYEVTELGMDADSEDSTDWMLRFLQSRAFLQLPTANIQGLLMKLEERPAKRGEVILQQGGQDDYYYIVKQGKCAVSRRPAPKAEDVRLAILSVGDGFGEEALITNGKRNATVTMQEDGVLMRLHKKDFMDLLVSPLIRYTDLTTARAQTKQHATLIDVRTNKAFSENGLEHASNIPLSMLRVKLTTLNPTSDYILYCDDGSQSAAAAFLMIQQGLNCKVIRNGIGAAPVRARDKAKQKTETKDNIVTLKHETPAAAASPVQAAKADPDQVKFEQHRRQAQEEARKAKAAEEARQAAESKTRQLKGEADKLRLQAERLAMKTASAETARKQAEEEITRIKSDAEGMRQQAAKDSSKMRQEAERLRLQAEQELAKIQQESASIQSQQDAIEKAAREAAQMAEQKSKEAEQAQRQAKAEAERVKAEAESIRQAAMQEADRLKQEMSQARKNAAKLEAEEAARREAELIAARQRAELAIQQAAQAAEDAKHQAALEAEAIRQKAQEEAERTRREAEAAATAAAERAEAQQRKQQRLLEKARRQAEATLKETTEAADKARREAEQEAEQIRQQALQEAEQLRREMESTRKLVEAEAAKAKARISEDSQRHQLIEAQRRRDEEAAAAAQQHAIEDAAHREAQQARQEKAEQARRLAESKQHDEQHARELAEAIMQKLNEAEQSRKDESVDANEGLHLAKATIRRVKDRTILEGDEDIFIFKEPKAHDLADDEELFAADDTDKRQTAAKTADHKARHDDDDLPSFLVETPEAASSDAGLIPELRVNVANYEHTAPTQTTTGSNSRKQLYALAASVALMIGIGIFSFNAQSPDPLEELATTSQPAKAGTATAETISTNNMASFAAGKNGKKEPRAEKKPESKVKKLLSRWKEKLIDKPEQ